MATFREIISYLTGGGGGGGAKQESGGTGPLPPVPKVDTTPTPFSSIGGRGAKIDTWSQDPWATVGPPPDRSQAARHDHPAGSAQRSRQQRREDRRAQRGYGVEHRTRFQPPTLWQPPVRDLRRESGDMRDQSDPRREGSGRIENPNPPPGYRS